MNADVVKFTTTAPGRAPSTRAPRKARQLRHPEKSSKVRAVKSAQQIAAIGIAAIGLLITALSLSHLAHAVGTITAMPAWQAWSTAAAFDLLLIGLEGAQVIATGACKAALRRVGPWTIRGVLVGSAAMNSFAFGEHLAGSYWLIASTAIGIAIPCLMLVSSKAALALWMDGSDPRAPID